MSKQKPQLVTRRQSARLQQEEEYQRRILLALGGITALVVLILTIGTIYTYVIWPRQAIATVGEEEISRQDYQNRVLYERFLLNEQANFIQAQAAQMLENFQDNPELSQSLERQAREQLHQIQMQDISLDRGALDNLIEEAIVFQEAATRGIIVESTEVDAAYQAQAALRRGGYTEVSVQETVTAREDATATAELFTPTPTSTPFPTFTPTSIPVITNTQGLTTAFTTEDSISETSAEDVSGTLRTPNLPAHLTTGTLKLPAQVEEASSDVSEEAGTESASEAASNDTPTPAPTPTINTIAGPDLTTAVSEWESLMQENANLTPNDLRRMIERNLLKEKLIEAFTETVDKTALQVQARHILVTGETDEEGEEKAQAVIARLEAGEDFEDLARELSEDPGSSANGGDLGWFGKGRMVTSFEEVAFEIEPGTISDPIQTQFGWHIIEVLDRGDRELDEAALRQNGWQAYEDWLTEARVNVQDDWTAEDAPRR